MNPESFPRIRYFRELSLITDGSQIDFADAYNAVVVIMAPDYRVLMLLYCNEDFTETKVV